MNYIAVLVSVVQQNESVIYTHICVYTFTNIYIYILGFPGGSLVKNPPAVQEMQEMRVQSLGWEDPLEEGMATHFSILV